MNVARDVIVVRAEDGSLHCSAFAVNFRPVSTLYKWLVSRPALSRFNLRGGARSTTSTTSTTSSSTENVDNMATRSSSEPNDDGPANTLASSILSSIGLSPSPPPTPSSAGAAAPPASTTSSTLREPGGATPPHSDHVEMSSAVISSPTDDSSLLHHPPSAAHHDTHHQHQHRRREGVEVYVCGKLMPGLEMVVDEKGACVFADTGTVHPSPAALGHLAAAGLLHTGMNPVEFIYCSPYGDVSVKATFHLWGVDDRVVVSDIDGTCTISDVRGYVSSVHLGNHEYTHEGIAPLFSHLHREHNLRFVYLTSRPFSLLEATRAYIANVEQEGGHKLPQGPIFTSSDSLTRVLYKELVERTIRYYKAQTLNDVATLFTKAGRRDGNHLFIFGFGNKIADGEAYEMVQIDAHNIFLINPSSEVRVFASYKESALANTHGAGSGRKMGEGGRVTRVFEWRRQLSPDVESPSVGAGGDAATDAGGGRKKEKEEVEEEEEGMDEEREGERRRSRSSTSENAHMEREDSSTHVYSSYSDARLLQVLERRLACHQRMRLDEERREGVRSG